MTETGLVVAESSAPIAARMRMLLRELVGMALDNMGSDMFAGMVRPFLPMVLPMIEKMSDANALAILAFVNDRVKWVERG